MCVSSVHCTSQEWETSEYSGSLLCKPYTRVNAACDTLNPMNVMVVVVCVSLAQASLILSLFGFMFRFVFLLLAAYLHPLAQSHVISGHGGAVFPLYMLARYLHVTLLYFPSYQKRAPD